jgi:hypothetical protein
VPTPVPPIPWLQAQYQNAGQIINDVAVEMGLAKSNAPLSSQDPNFIQLQTLANLTGRDLVKKYEWQLFTISYTFETVSSGPPPPDGITYYPTPNDFYKMVDQTAWNRTSRLPMAGPLSAQAWEWLVGLVSNQFTIYLGFRMWGGQFAIYPSPNPASQEIAFEYQSSSWLLPAAAADASAPNRTNLIVNASDLVLYDPLLFGRALKVRLLAAKGFDNTDAVADFEQIWESVVGPDAAAAKLNLADNGFGMRYLDALNNVPPSGFGMP